MRAHMQAGNLGSQNILKGYLGFQKNSFMHDHVSAAPYHLKASWHPGEQAYLKNRNKTIPATTDGLENRERTARAARWTR